jgi:hypothetical protein
MHRPQGARLNNQWVDDVTIGAWAAGSASPGEYLQVDLGSVKMITNVSTQGRPSRHDQWVTEYTVSYSNDTNNWKNYEGDCVQVRGFYSGGYLCLGYLIFLINMSLTGLIVSVSFASLS